jgi:hypothetical protein
MPIRSLVLEACCLLLCLAGIVYGLLMVLRPDIVQRILTSRSGRWHNHGPAPYSIASKVLGLVYIIAGSAFIAFFLVKMLHQPEM